MGPVSRRYTFLLVSAIFIPAFLFALFAWHSRSEALREGESTTERSAAILVEHARKVFDTVDLLLDYTAYQLQVRGNTGRPELNDDLSALVARYGQIVSVWVADATGVVVAGSQHWEPGGSVAGRDFFDAQRDKASGVFVSAVFVGRVTNTRSFAVSRRRENPDGSFAGTIHVALSPAYFEEFFAETAPSLKGVSSLIRADGEVLARSPGLGRTRLPANNLLSRGISANSRAGISRGRSTSGGGERLLSYRQVGILPIYSTFAVDIAEINKQWLNKLPPIALGWALATAVLAWMAWLTVRSARSAQAALVDLQAEMSQRQMTEDRLRHTQRLEAVGRLTGGVAHDFNNLLMVVLGNAERLRKSRTSPADQRAIDAILTAAKNGESLNRQLLAFARRQPLAPEVIDVADTLTGTLSMISASLRGRVDVILDVDQDSWRIKVDVSEFRLAVLNLCANARDAMPDGGRIIIKAFKSNVASDRLTGRKREGEFVAIAVSDTGAGMESEILPKVFEPFFTTKNVGHGTGLGLSQVHGFVSQSGGTIDIDTYVGKGTTVSLFLPRSLEPISATGPVEAVESARHEGHVVLVEDESRVADITRLRLEDLGYTVDHVRNADEALARFHEGNLPSIVISDIVMPGSMSGADLARILRKKFPKLPVILMTGYNLNNENLAEDDFTVMQKPFTTETLEATIRRLLPVSGA